MNTLTAAQQETHTQRYEALLRMAKALAVCQDCDRAAEVLESQLREVASFDYLHAVAYDTTTGAVAWEMLHANGRTLDVSDRYGFLREAPTDWVYQSGEVL